MSAAVAKLARLRPGVRGYTVADLHTLPEDGPRCELIDGSIIVSPSATVAHNMVARWIAQLIEDANPGDGHVVGTDQSVTVDEHNEPRPDVVVRTLTRSRSRNSCWRTASTGTRRTTRPGCSARVGRGRWKSTCQAWPHGRPAPASRDRLTCLADG